MPTRTRWRRPVRRCQTSAAASAAAAIVACATVPTANDDGSTGSAPVGSTSLNAASSKPASHHNVASTYLASGAEILLILIIGLIPAQTRLPSTETQNPASGEAHSK